MTIVNNLGLGADVPTIASLGVTGFSFSSATMDAAGEQVHFVGELCLEGYAGSKTFSSAGGKIHWTTLNVTFANAGTTFRVGIQDALAAAGVAQGDGTFDVYDDLVGATDTIAATSNIVTTMSTGSVSLSHGQKIAIAFSMTSRGGTDSVAVRVPSPAANPSTYLFPCVTTNSSGSFARVSYLSNAIIEFDDGTIGWIRGGWAHTGSSATPPFALDTGTADEYGMVINLQYKALVDGITVVVTPSNSSADFELCLYSDPLGTPSLIEAITVNADHLGSSNGVGTLRAAFSATRTLNPGIYCVSIRPTTTNSVSMNYFDVAAASHLKANGHYGSYAVRRLDNSGAFGDYNGGTAETRRLPVALSVVGYDNGINNKPNYNLGVY